MPVSEIATMPSVMAYVATLNPAGIVELGVGFGKVGVLCREVLEAVHGRVHPSEFQGVLVGIEGFPRYDNPCWSLYNRVIIEDFRKYYTHIRGWPLVMMIDSLEHVDREEAFTILDYLVANNGCVIVSVPIGQCPQGACFGNELETHRSIWLEHDFDKYKHTRLHKGVCLAVAIHGNKNVQQNRQAELEFAVAG